MNPRIKKFIEQNIDKIDAEDWDAVIQSWYRGANYFYDEVDFETFNAMLNHCGIDFLRVSRSAREQCIKNRASAIINNSSDGIIKKSKILSMFLSNIGFTDEELEVLVDEAAEALGYEVDFDEYYRGK